MDEHENDGLTAQIAFDNPGPAEVAAPTFGALAPRIVANGWSVFPQTAFGERRTPGRVDGAVLRWKETHDLENRASAPEALAQWIAQCRDHAVALVCGPASGDVCGIDIDVADPETNGRLVGLADDMLGPTAFRRTGRAPKTVLFYRWRADPGGAVPGRRTFRFDHGGEASSEGIEILSRGSPVTIFGAHRITGLPYRWSGPSPYDSRPSDLPEVSPASVEAFVAAVDRMRPFHRGAGMA